MVQREMVKYAKESSRSGVAGFVAAEPQVANSIGTGYTALILASVEGHTDIAKLLIQAGANMDLKDNVSQYSMFNMLYTAMLILIYDIILVTHSMATQHYTKRSETAMLLLPSC
jgi:ankyrin repeat protein